MWKLRLTPLGKIIILIIICALSRLFSGEKLAGSLLHGINQPSLDDQSKLIITTENNYKH